MTPQKKHLFELRDFGQFLFHGSGEKQTVLEPRQAYTYLIENKKVPDGEPAVFASENPDVAVFMAIFSGKNLPHLQTWFGEDENGNPLFKAAKETLDALPKNAVGYVHVLKRDGFKKRGDGVQWVSHTPVTPMKTIEVTREDLPEIKTWEL